jgi:hypothetical protein
MLDDPVFQRDLVKLFLQYGLLAGVLAAFTAYAARALERLKTGLGWETEMLKQSFAVASDVPNALDELAEAHRQIVGRKILKNLDPEHYGAAFHSAERKVLALTSRAALVFPRDTAVRAAIEDVRNAVMTSVARWSLGTASAEDLVESEREQLLSKEMATVDEKFEKALETLATQFQSKSGSLRASA